MVTITKEPQVHEPEERLLTPEQDEDGAEEPTITVEDLIEELIAVPLAAHEEIIPVRIARRILAFYGWLSGPAMTKQERMRGTVAHAENTRRIVWYV